MRAVERAVALTSVLLLTGCSSDLFNRDGEALDRFSHAYTEFRDSGEDTEAVIHFSQADTDPFGFWIAFKGAFATDPSSNDFGRLSMAKAAIAGFDSTMPTVVGGAADAVEKLDKAVQRLFETANAIHNQDYRENAIRVAKYARQAQASVALIQTLVDRRLGLQRRLLSDVVGADGSLVRAIRTSALKLEGAEAEKLTHQIQDAAKNSTTAMQNMKDTFSALKGMTNLKAYPTKDELQEQKKDR